jgi:hypothetical protein
MPLSHLGTGRRHLLLLDLQYATIEPDTLTQLIFREDPANGPDSRRGPNNTVERNLTDWNKCDSSVHGVDDKMVENVVVGVNKYGVFT